MLSFSLLAGAFLCLSIEQRFACSRFSRTDVLSGMPLRGREEDDTSYRKRKSGRSMRRNEGSSQHRILTVSPCFKLFLVEVRHESSRILRKSSQKNSSCVRLGMWLRHSHSLRSVFLWRSISHGLMRHKFRPTNPPP